MIIPLTCAFGSDSLLFPSREAEAEQQIGRSQLPFFLRMLLSLTLVDSAGNAAAIVPTATDEGLTGAVGAGGGTGAGAGGNWTARDETNAALAFSSSVRTYIT